MNEIIMESAALLLTLFCLVYSLNARRTLYLPGNRGGGTARKAQHLYYLLLLGGVALSAAMAVGGTLQQWYAPAHWSNVPLHMAYHLLRLFLPALAALYALRLSGEQLHAGSLLMYLLPELPGILLIVSRPAARICFSTEDVLACYRGQGGWVLYVAAAFYALMAVAALFRGNLPRIDRASGLLLLFVASAGTAVQAAWSVPSELFSAAVTLFGAMALLEHDEDASASRMSDRFRISAVVAVAAVFLAVILTNITLIQKLSREQSDLLGNTRLDVIRSDLEDTISEAETNLLQVGIRAEQLLEADPSRGALEQYFQAQRESLLSGEALMNVFIAGRDWHIVPGFDAPPDFHASERTWYLGALEHPGQVYVTEPYQDADTGDMCFTVSTLLSDGETVVGLDLNFSKVQETIQRMSDGRDQTAMIVTSGGLIAGYSDMTLVGQRAEDRLPDFSGVFQRVTASREHRSFRLTLDGESCVIFSSETDNHWYLILIVTTRSLYLESYRQMAMLVAVNLLMLVVVLVFYLLSTRNRLQAGAVMEENRRFLQELVDKLRQPVMQILRISSAQILEEGGDPAAVQIHDCGAALNRLLDNSHSYADLLRQQAEQEAEQRKRRKASSTQAPSRILRNQIIFVLVFSLLVALVLCYRNIAALGGSRMNREADAYENQLEEWIALEKSRVWLLTDLLSAQPELLEDYEGAVGLLADFTARYPEISACYIANPFSEHPVVMNSGWEPSEEDRPENRPWYRETERSPEGFNISSPYLDAQTGNYCITFSRVIYGENGAFLGVFGVDFFLDKLVQVLGESYSNAGYAFLVDSNGVIVNHPNPAYQMGEGTSVPVTDTEYAEAFHREGVHLLLDYDGRLVTCLSRHTDSGFTVMAAYRWWPSYGSMVLVTLAFLALFGFCILVIVLLINRLIRWQESVNRQLVEAADAARKADRAKSQFLAQMSHEIRTPMNAIIGLDNIALREPELSRRTREQLEKIGASARHLLALINDILDMSRIESGRMELKETEFSFRELLDQIQVIINGQCVDKGLRFVFQPQGPVDACFVGDDLKLKQVLINILGNSVKFTDAPGTVSFSVEETGRQEGQCTLRFIVSDTGIGMDADFLPRLFDAFSQEDATNSNRYGGSGLGMAITKRMVDMMGGEILVESQRGVGSTFTVIVPLKEGAAPAQPEQGPEPEEEASLAGRHVLIAEDNEINAEILLDLLELEEVSAEWAKNGKEAVELFAAGAPGTYDAVLMDMRMPVMDGLTAAAELRKLDRPDARTIPIIALTANAFEEDVQQCLQAGMDAHLSKPVDIDLLTHTLRRLLAARKGEA